MSLIGKGSTSIRKKDVMEQKSIALGFKKMVFAHKANVGETGLNLTALVTPTEMSANGFVNPSVAELSRVNINQFKNNLKLVSSLSGILIPNLSYVVTSSNTIIFKDFTAAQDEIFVGYIDEAPTTSLSVVDGQPIITSGILTAGQTDFNIGTPIEINKYSSKQHGAVLVFVDRALQYRKVGNVTSGDGDYIEVPVAGGLGSLIRFDASMSDRYVTVISNGVVAERPDGSMTAMIERVQGQVDQIVPTLAALTGLPTSTWQTAPNDVDLKQFGDTVLSNQTTLTNHETRITNVEPTNKVDAYLLNTFAGHGATNTKIPYFTNVTKNITDGLITMSNSSTLGLSFTANQLCEVTITFCHHAWLPMGISLNTAATTTNIGSIAASERVAYAYHNSATSGDSMTTITFTTIMSPGDVLRPHTSGTAPSTAAYGLCTLTARGLS